MPFNNQFGVPSVLSMSHMKIDMLW